MRYDQVSHLEVLECSSSLDIVSEGDNGVIFIILSTSLEFSRLIRAVSSRIPVSDVMRCDCVK